MFEDAGECVSCELKNCIGEMLFAIAESDGMFAFFPPTSLINPDVFEQRLRCRVFGYGNVAGYLFHKGIMNPPLPSNPNANPGPSTTKDGKSINLITGTTTEKQRLI